ncbi:MAG: SGNH/GDSL hydrolase family protein [Pseudomonadota bacterium]
MRPLNHVLALAVAMLVAACGGSSDERPRYSAQVVFGDSLADVGTDRVGAVAAAGGGRFTINGDSTAVNPALTGKVWSELIAVQLGLPAPCAAQTGLDGDPALGFSVPVANHPGCFGYAQPGARVTEPIGPRHKLTGSPLGQLTVPVVTQIANHLALSGGRFSGTEVVFVTAGGNDAIFLLDQLAAGATAAGAAAFGNTLVGALAAGATNPAAAAAAIGAALQAELARPGHTDASVVQAAVGAAARQPGNAAVADAAVYGPIVARAQADAQAAGAAHAAANGPAVVAAMARAGAELAELVRNRIVANGANFVVVNNMPDISITPIARPQPPPTQALIGAMVDGFNSALKNGLAGAPKVLQVDLFAFTHDQATNPALYGLTNVVTGACGPNLLGGSSLLCNTSNLKPGDVSHYMFADDAHPTPYEHALVAKFIAQRMATNGWL